MEQLESNVNHLKDKGSSQ